MNPLKTPVANGLKGNKKLGARPVFDIGRSVSPCERKAACDKLKKSLETPAMRSSRVVKLQATTSGRKTPELKAPSSSLAFDPLLETADLTGNPFGPPPSPEIWTPSPPRYEFVVIGPFEQLVLIIHEQDQWRENALYSGAKLDLESPGVLGKKPEWKLTAKIPERSFGTVTKWRRMLSSMSFEEELTLPISCAGSTVIQSEWRSKAPVVPWLQGSSGSPPISVQTNGILNAI